MRRRILFSLLTVGLAFICSNITVSAVSAINYSSEKALEYAKENGGI